MAEVGAVKLYTKKVREILRKSAKLDKGLMRQTLNLLKELRKGVKDSLTVAKGFQAGYLPQILAEIDRQSALFAGRLSPALLSNQAESWELGKEFSDNFLAGAGFEPGRIPMLSDKQLLSLNAITLDTVDKITEDVRSDLRGIVQRAVIGEKSVFQTMKDIDSKLKTLKKKGVTFRAETIARTETSSAFSIANYSRFKQTAETVPGTKKVWDTAKDERVRDAHRIAGDKYTEGGSPGPIPFKESFVVGGERLNMPLDPAASGWNRINCRCRMRLILPE